MRQTWAQLAHRTIELCGEVRIGAGCSDADCTLTLTVKVLGVFLAGIGWEVGNWKDSSMYWVSLVNVWQSVGTGNQRQSSSF